MTLSESSCIQSPDPVLLDENHASECAAALLQKQAGRGVNTLGREVSKDESKISTKERAPHRLAVPRRNNRMFTKPERKEAEKV